MLTEILTAYAGVSLLVAGVTIRRFGRRPLRQGEHIDGADRFVLVTVALLASVAWAAFLPLYLIGWLSSSEARALGDRVARLLRLRRPPVEPAHRVAG